jgi:hypothetical protein
MESYRTFAVAVVFLLYGVAQLLGAPVELPPEWLDFLGGIELSPAVAIAVGIIIALLRHITSGPVFYARPALEK